MKKKLKVLNFASATFAGLMTLLALLFGRSSNPEHELDHHSLELGVGGTSFYVPRDIGVSP